MASRRLRLTLTALLVAATVVSWRDHFDTLTWFLEAAPVLVALPLLWALHGRFGATRLFWWCVFAHALVLLVGAHYTYARVPPGDWVRDALGLQRNHYDRLGHVAQGFFPAIFAREVIWRTSPLRGSRWLPFLVGSFCLAFSALYELVEWWVALLAEEGDAVSFLATQGDPWDTQWDMCLALAGAVLALATLSRLHDRQLVAAVGS